MLRPRGPATRPVLFIQGGVAGAHDQWDNKLVASLSGALGKGWRVRYPRLPGEADPSYAGWAPAIRAEILASREAIKRDTRLLTGSPLPRGDKPLVLVGHSLGGTILAAALAEEAPTVALAAIVLVSAPFVGEGGWPEDGFALPADRRGCRCTSSTASPTTPPRRPTPTCGRGRSRRRLCTSCRVATTS